MSPELETCLLYPPLGGIRKKMEDMPPRLNKADEVDRTIADSSQIVLNDRSVDKRTARGGSEVASVNALRVELLPPPPTYPVDGEPWTVVGSKHARKRARKKKKGKKGDVLGVITGKTANLGAVLPPSTGASDARRAVAGGDTPKTIRSSYAAAADSVLGNGNCAVVSCPTIEFEG